jgi:threonine synthase
VNLRPFYAEGSKTVAFEIAEQLGWRLPDVLVGPIASGSLFTKVAKGFEEAGDDRARRAQGGSPRRRPAGGLCSRRDGVCDRRRDRPGRAADTIVRSLAIGSPADGGYAIDLATRTGGSIEAVEDAVTAATIRRVAATEGIFVETAGGVTVAAAEQARAKGIIRDGDEVVALLTGNGLKTPDARRFGTEETDPELAPPIPPTYSAFDARYGAS